MLTNPRRLVAQNDQNVSDERLIGDADLVVLKTRPFGQAHQVPASFL